MLQLLPRGRAWQSNEGGPLMGLVRAFDPGTFDDPPFQTRQRTQSVLAGFWRAIASVVTFILARYCDLRLEFWCATHKETHDLWMAEYGLPDACDPFPDLCTKVAAIGGVSCEYYAAVAARAGWSITCADITNDCGGSAGTFQAGCSWPGGQIGGGRLLIIVDLDDSPAYVAPAGALPYARRHQCRNADLQQCGPHLEGDRLARTGGCLGPSGEARRSYSTRSCNVIGDEPSLN
ncbi:hypothetical protein [Bradyrhizobium sp. SZCCHNS2005]|uniref:hypothetical protein n=2 Tax=unclassified Bradyrhizobium TaxID=2631580 RepID=UPI0028EF5856|nr:hypothetical protein [Bradyrhizobium sp. SZCCHNS2005]